ncbi:MAG: hypothetical protein L0H64_17595 [Pseudonocardia sp.]|nr:hypothetical protein [Pseudonocardia sp.]
MTGPQREPTVLRIEDVAERTGLPLNTLRHWRYLTSAGTPTGPRSYRLGRRVVYDLADVEAWLTAQRAATGNGSAGAGRGTMRPTLLGMGDLAERIGVPLNTLRYWRYLTSVGTPTGPCSYRLGRRVVYDLADVEAWLTAQRAATRQRLGPGGS